MSPDIQVLPVTSKKELRDVCKFPSKVYRDDPNWVPPLIGERMAHYDPHHNPFFDHAEVQFFRAIRNGETVGTIAAIHDPLHIEVWDEPVGFFGIFEVIHDYAVAEALFDTAKDWLLKKGCSIMRGPMNLNINDECGLLIDGFDGSPVIMMTYNPRYYEEFVERYGFTKAKDLYAHLVDIASFGKDMENLPEQVSRVATIAQERYGVTIRPVNLSKIYDELELIKPIHREAWNKNWGALPMSDAEFRYLADGLKQILDPDVSYLAFIDGEAVGCFVVLPDLHQVLKKVNGSLFPFGWAKFLWYKRKVDCMRVLIMGVLEEHRLKGIESLFYREGCRIALEKGYKKAEMSWLLEDNYKVIRGVEMMGGKRYRTYRLYDVAIS